MKSRKLGVILLSIILVTSTIIIPLASAKPGQVTIRVRYVDKKGKEKTAVDVMVEIESEDGTESAFGYTDEKGKVVLKTKGDTTYKIYIKGSSTPSGTFTTHGNGGAGAQNVNIPS